MEDTVFISTDELQELINALSVQIIDTGMDHKQAYLDSHIPGAIFFNITEIRSKTSNLSIGFPSLEEFREYMIALGIKNDGGVKVVYDRNIILTGRTWYLLRHFGVANVRILNGGLSKWLAEGRSVERGEPVESKQIGSFRLSDYKFTENYNYIALYPEVKKISEEIHSGRTNAKIWDLRAKETFDAGTVDSAINYSWDLFLNPDKTVKPPEEVKKICKKEIGRGRIIVTCMKGIAACFGLALLTYCGHKDRKIYTGSYEEWSSASTLSNSMNLTMESLSLKQNISNLEYTLLDANKSIREDKKHVESTRFELVGIESSISLLVKDTPKLFFPQICELLKDLQLEMKNQADYNDYLEKQLTELQKESSFIGERVIDFNTKTKILEDIIG